MFSSSHIWVSSGFGSSIWTISTWQSKLQGFWYFAQLRSREIQVNLWNPTKFTKTRKIPRNNSVEILSNTCLYSNFETCLSYWGYLLALNSQIYVKTLSLKLANNVPKLPRCEIGRFFRDFVPKNPAKFHLTYQKPWNMPCFSNKKEKKLESSNSKVQNQWTLKQRNTQNGSKSTNHKSHDLYNPLK